MPPDQLTPAQLAQAWPSVADNLARLHSITTSTCPYGRTLEKMMALARATARRADHDFAARYGITLDPDRQDFYLRLDPLT